jgi:hypothetical protein
VVAGARGAQGPVPCEGVVGAVDARLGGQAQLIGVAGGDGMLALRDHGEVVGVTVAPHGRGVGRGTNGWGCVIGRGLSGKGEGVHDAVAPVGERAIPEITERDERHGGCRVIEGNRTIKEEQRRVRVPRVAGPRHSHGQKPQLVTEPPDPAEREAADGVRR